MSQAISETRFQNPQSIAAQTIIIRSTTGGGTTATQDPISRIIAPISIADIESIKTLELIAGQISLTGITGATIENTEITDIDGTVIASGITITEADIEGVAIHDIEIRDESIIRGTITSGSIIRCLIEAGILAQDIGEIEGLQITKGIITCGHIQ